MCNATTYASTCARSLKYTSALDRLEVKADVIEKKIAVYDRFFRVYNLRKSSSVAKLRLKEQDALKAKYDQLDRVYIWIRDRLYFY